MTAGGGCSCIPALRRSKQENLDLKASLGLYNEFKAILELCRRKKVSNECLMAAETLCGGKSLPKTCRDSKAPGCAREVFPEETEKKKPTLQVSVLFHLPTSQTEFKKRGRK